MLLFLPVCFLVVAGALLLGESRIDAELSMLMADETTFVELGQGRLDQELAVPIGHLMSLINESPVRRVYQASNGSDASSMQEAFISLMSRNPIYDKVRWIDEQGNERVRVNNRRGRPVVVPENELQAKDDRYFFTETMRLDQGGIYISPLDLNMDDGRIEIPYKPTIRVSSPVFYDTGKPRGILIINIMAKSMLNAFVHSAGPAIDRLMLVNDEGYWLKSPDSHDEWGFMFQREATLATQHPQLWAAISRQKKGQIRLDDGLWTWSSVSLTPIQDARLSHNIHWKVVSHLPMKNILMLEKKVWVTKVVSALIILLLFTIGIGRLIQAKAARALAEQATALARSEAEAAIRLQEAQACFQLLFEANSSGLLVVDAEGQVVMANPAFEAMFYYSVSEVLNRPVEMLLPAQFRSCHARLRKDYLRNPSRRAMGEGRDLYGNRKDGSIFPIEIGLSPYRNNNHVFVVATIVDISERKRNQDALLQMNETLERSVAERTAELQAAKQEAERLASVKGNFLANMSHEIRTPMNAILGLAYLLEKADLGTDELNLVKKIRIAGRSLLGIINDILDFSKIESGRLEIEHAPFRLNDVLDNVATLMSAIEYSNKVELIMGPAPEGIEFLRGDALRLEQILVNLTSNALKFTKQGSVTITVIKLPDKDGQDYLRFSVRDTGMGIPIEKQAEIFNAFSQEDASTTRRFGGTGLGLTICRYLVQMMGGELGVNSELGLGSEFWLVLPIELVEPQEYVHPSIAFQNVLIADDHPVAREMLAATVRSLGWTPEVVESGEEAVERIIERARNNKLPDILLLDWCMPGVNGLEAGKRIRQELGEIANAPIIVIATVHDRDALLREPEVAVADAVMHKPITASSLYNAVSDAKQRRQGQRSPQHKNFAPFEKRLNGLTLLLVDDSEINRDMARRILEAEGATVYLAGDGHAALEWLRLNPDLADVVVMDIQMPLMDGYEATHQIREVLGLTLLPIVALTAGAFKNQQAAALNAGMNGFIAKPFDVEELIAYLQQYVTGLQVTVDSKHEPIASAATGDSKPPMIDIDRGLNNWGDAATYYKYLQKFAESHGHDGDEIAKLIAQGERESALALAHKLKGTAGNLALIQVWKLAEKIESRHLEGGGTADDSVQQLQSVLHDTLREINRLNGNDKQNDTMPPELMNAKFVRTRLNDLLMALDRDNPDEVEPLLLELEKTLPRPMLRPIQELVDSFDFRAAEEQTKKLINRLSNNDLKWTS